jgi:hypothetical protein
VLRTCRTYTRTNWPLNRAFFASVQKKAKKDPRVGNEGLRSRGATEDECNFLVRGQKNGQWWGDRIELNAMTAKVFIEYVIRKLKLFGVEKVVPDTTVLETAWERLVRTARVNAELAKIVERVNREPVPPPPSDLRQQIDRCLLAHPEVPWDVAMWQVVNAQATGQNGKPRRGKST